MHGDAPFLLLLSSTPSCRCAAHLSTVHPLKVIWVVSMFQQLRRELLDTCADGFSREQKFSFLRRKCPGMELLGHLVPNFIRNRKAVFRGDGTILYS